MKLWEWIKNNIYSDAPVEDWTEDGIGYEDGSIFYPDSNEFVCGDGLALHNIHERGPLCEVQCVIHNPSDHSMRSFPTHWRSDRYRLERTAHGVGQTHPIRITSRSFEQPRGKKPPASSPCMAATVAAWTRRHGRRCSSDLRILS